MPTIAVDPGHSGGAVLLGDAGRPVAAWAWHKLKRKSGDVYRLEEANAPSAEARTIADVGALLCLAVCELTHGETLHLAVEGQYVDRRRLGTVPTTLELARVSGWLTAGLAQRAVDVVTPLASQWRPAVLGISAYATSEASERAALLRWRTLWRGELEDNPHVGEAAGIGAWAMAQRRLEVTR